jgi:hypothetical protein
MIYSRISEGCKYYYPHYLSTSILKLWKTLKWIFFIGNQFIMLCCLGGVKKISIFYPHENSGYEKVIHIIFSTVDNLKDVSYFLSDRFRFEINHQHGVRVT